jgi:hypothetical protein
MITLQVTRSEVQTVTGYFFSYIDLYKITRLKNVEHYDKLSEEYLSAVVINSLITELEELFKKKLATTRGWIMTFRFSDAHGIVLYKTLLALPIPRDQEYLDIIRNHWIHKLDRELQRIDLFSLLFNGLKAASA